MWQRLVRLVLALFAFRAGRGAGVAAVQAAEMQEMGRVAENVTKAEAAVPSDRTGVADRLRKGEF